MFLEILEVSILVFVSYFIYAIAEQKILYYRLRKQIPFVKSDFTNPIKNFFLGNTRTLNFQKDVSIFSRWRKECNSDIYGINVSILPSVVVYDRDLITLIATSKLTADFVKSTEVQVVLKDIKHGILLLEGDAHAKVRNVFLPIFSMENIQKMQPVFCKFSHQLVDKLKSIELASNNNYPISNDISCCTLDIISKVAFNYDMNALQGGSNISDAFEKLLNVNEFTPILLFKFVFPLMDHLIIDQEHNKALKTIHTVIDNVIKERVGQQFKGNDLLSKCLESVGGKPSKETMTEFRDEIFTMMAAGHETTSTALTWAIYALASHPNIQQTLREAVGHLPVNPSFEQINNIQYLDNVCNEVLRLYSPVSNLNRTATKAFNFKGYTFPVGTKFLIQLQSLHMDETLFEEPMLFNPDRWNGMVLNDPYKFIPFWTGFRGCIGKKLALNEFKTILAIVIREIAFTINKEHQKVERCLRITQKPSAVRVGIKSVDN